VKIQFPRWCFIFLFQAVWFGLNGFSQSLHDLKKAYQDAENDTSRLKILSDMHWASLTEAPEQSKQFALQEIALGQKINNLKWLAQGYNDLGISEQKELNFRQAIRTHTKALEIRRQIGDANAIGSSLSKIGTCYSEINSLEAALKAQLEALVLFRKVKNTFSIAYTLNNICFIYNELKQYDLLKKCADESYQLNKELGDDFGLASSLNYLATLDEERKDYKAALLKHEEGLKLSQKRGDSLEIATYLNNMGFIYNKLGDEKKALSLYSQAKEIVLRRKDYNSAILYTANEANILISRNKLKEADLLLRQALSLSQKENLTLHLPQIYAELADLFTVRCEVDSALKYYQANVMAIRRIFTEDVSSRISSLQNQYEIDIREQQKKILKQEIELKESSLLRFRWLSVALVAGILLLFAVFFLFRNRQKLLQQKQLNEERLLQQEMRTKAIIETEEKERTRIARELHDGLGQQLSAAKMNIASLKSRISQQDPDQIDLVENAVLLVDDAVREVRSISHNMMANALIKNGLASAVRDFVQKMSAGGSIRTDLEIVGLQDRLDPTLEMMLYRVLQELVNNILKHAQASVVSIQLIRHDSSIVLQVEDNGIGFTPESANDGIGLANIRSRVEILQGSFYVDSQPGHGTTSTIEVPLGG